jgi:ABC-type antimicrobial peptide transport system permease subunit
MAFLPLEDQVSQSLGSERLIATLSTAFAAIALLLSAIGLFGSLALRVNQRTPEFGIRLAVGATRENLLTMVLREAMVMVAVGAAAGILLAAAGSTLIRRFLYGTSGADIGVAFASLAALLLVALVAALLPARRAASIDPMQALRSE